MLTFSGLPNTASLLNGRHNQKELKSEQVWLLAVEESLERSQVCGELNDMRVTI